MSFDIDPRDKEQRFLMYHPESDCLYECHSIAEMEHAVASDGMSVDVTGEEKAEARFKAENESKNS